MIEIDKRIWIPKRELEFKFGTSSGPGGQHVNKVETKVTLLFHVQSSSVFSPQEKERLHARLSTRINRNGFLRVYVKNSDSNDILPHNMEPSR